MTADPISVLINAVASGTVAAAVIGMTLAIVGWFSREAVTRLMNRAVERFKHDLKLDEIRQGLLLQSTAEFQARQLSEFYWPIYVRLLTDNAVWDRILDRNKEDDVRRRVAAEIERSQLIPNHEQVVDIIRNKIHLAQADGHLRTLLMRYVRHVAVYRALRSSGVTDRDPLDLNEPWPRELFPLIEQKTMELQAEYNKLIAPSRLGATAANA